ncbi:hypothetical protein PoB_007020800 [Plakobranchus ocellatus]|uniref:Uncharacterized protein n=1 Tax=Plakobranchus ocellatus TaxID=259542 RepID=A0AAV4DI26_9GAST|nr:hypothetical protein PoB_007020800 [Plakobranchus ocellatus]
MKLCLFKKWFRSIPYVWFDCRDMAAARPTAWDARSLKETVRVGEGQRYHEYGSKQVASNPLTSCDQDYKSGFRSFNIVRHVATTYDARLLQTMKK